MTAPARSPLLDQVDADLAHLLDETSGFGEPCVHWETGRRFVGVWTDEAVLGGEMQFPEVLARSVDCVDVAPGHTVRRGLVPYYVHEAHPDGQGLTTLTLQRIP